VKNPLRKYGSRARYYHKRLKSPRLFAKASLRTISIGGGKKMIVGCPKGYWDARRRRCRAGTRGQAILTPKSMNFRRRKYTVVTAPPAVRRRWLRKAIATRRRKYLARCRAAMKGAPVPAPVSVSRVASAVTATKLPPPPTMAAPVEAPVAAPRLWGSPYKGPDREPLGSYRESLGLEREQFVPDLPEFKVMDNPSALDEVRAGSMVTIADYDGKLRTGRAVMPSSHGGWVLNLGGAHGTPAIADERNIVRVGGGSRRLRGKNPELLVMYNPDGSPSSAVPGAELNVRQHRTRRGAMRRRRRGRNLPLTVRIGGRKHTWRALVKRYGVRGAKRKWRGKKKYHGYSRTRVHNRRGRRRRRYNSWRGQRRRHARAARKGWRRRSRKYARRRGRRGRRRGGHCGRRRRSRCVRYRGRLISTKTLVRKIGKKRAKRLLKRRGRKVRFN